MPVSAGFTLFSFVYAHNELWSAHSLCTLYASYDTDLLSAIVCMADARHCGAYARVDDSYDGWTRPSAEQVTGRPAKVRTRHFFRILGQLEMEAALGWT